MSIASICIYIGYFGVLVGFGATLVKFWHKLQDIVVGQQCELRSEITAIYYKHIDECTPTLREYERKNLDDLYYGYKALGGNHFIEDLYSQMRTWRVDQ